MACSQQGESDGYLADTEAPCHVHHSEAGIASRASDASSSPAENKDEVVATELLGIPGEPDRPSVSPTAVMPDGAVDQLPAIQDNPATTTDTAKRDNDGPPPYTPETRSEVISDDDDDVVFVRSRKIVRIDGSPPSRYVRVKVEPGTSEAAPSQRCTNASIFSLRSRHTADDPGRLAPGPASNHTNKDVETPEPDVTPCAPPKRHEAGTVMFQTEDLPPAYEAATSTRDLERIVREQNAGLENRLVNRLVKDIKTGNKRTRGVLSLDEAEERLKQASAEYTRAKAAADRRGAKYGKRRAGDNGDDPNRDFGNRCAKGGYGDKKDKGEKGGYKW